MSERKKHHYIPKFYLRNFSYKGNGNQIGIFNTKKNIFKQKAKLKTQGYENYFYGKDGFVEDQLSKIENILAPIISEIIRNRKLPPKFSDNHINLLYFIVIIDMRNPYQLDNYKNKLFQLQNFINTNKFNSEYNDLKFNPTKEELISSNISISSELVYSMLDLDYKLLINKTNHPFISSDKPCVKYNQYLQQKNNLRSMIGYNTLGIQLFIPLDSELTLLLYDTDIYKVGNRLKSYIEIDNIDDLTTLNILQLKNCINTVYFDDMASESYIRKTVYSTKEFINKPKIRRIKIRSRAKIKIINPHKLYIRPSHEKLFRNQLR